MITRLAVTPDHLRALYPGYFALVMGTEIVSTALWLGAPGWRTISTALWFIGGAAYLILWVLYVARASRFPDATRRDLADPARAFGYFTITAGSNVLAVRSLLAGWPAIAIGLGALGVAMWVVLFYGLFTQFIVGETVAFTAINGVWLIAVVAEQSISTLASALALYDSLHRELFVLVALVFWALGVVLYLLFIGLILDRLFFRPVTAEDLTPPYWINMGATAITVLAAARLLILPDPPTLLATLHPFITGIALVLWAWGTAWIPLLVLLGGWKYLVGRERLAYHPAQWSIVFPLGMYATATMTFSQVPGAHLLAPIGHAFIWVGLVAWCLVAGLGVAGWGLRRVRRPAAAPPQAPPRPRPSRPSSHRRAP